ncbi:phage baseplate protein [Acetobacter sp. DmW_043]|uniref:phage baseplate protein n=1 Tax=Acetobacter sp. DmW_043 TaxID=1670658 RepID=UPI001E3DF61C|nr:hypothetical protein [Acetobacter sp. DmW_043]
MVMFPVALPQVWSVPETAGVPALRGRSAWQGVRAAASVTAGQVLNDLLVSQSAGQWGIFSATGDRVLSAARVMSVATDSRSRVATAPLEGGGFMSYSKVEEPCIHRVQMVCDGTETGLGAMLSDMVLPKALLDAGGAGEVYVRKVFFETLESLKKDLSLYTVITPERKYNPVNVTGCRWLRDSRHGITMPVVEITLQEIRQAAAPSFTSSRMPEGQSVQYGGMVPVSTMSSFPRQNFFSRLTGGLSDTLSVTDFIL